MLAFAPSPLAFTVLLLIYGASFGALDTAMSSQGAVLEKLAGRLQMSGFHACYSLGTLGVAVADCLLIRAGASFPVCSLLDAGAVLAILSQGSGWCQSRDAPVSTRPFARPNRHTFMLGLASASPLS